MYANNKQLTKQEKNTPSQIDTVERIVRLQAERMMK